MGITSVAVSPVTRCRELRKSRRGGVMNGADGDPTLIWVRSTVRKNCRRLFEGPKSAPIHSQAEEISSDFRRLPVETRKRKTAWWPPGDSNPPPDRVSNHRKTHTYFGRKRKRDSEAPQTPRLREPLEQRRHLGPRSGREFELKLECPCLDFSSKNND